MKFDSIYSLKFKSNHFHIKIDYFSINHYSSIRYQFHNQCCSLGLDIVHIIKTNIFHLINNISQSFSPGKTLISSAHQIVVCSIYIFFYAFTFCKIVRNEFVKILIYVWYEFTSIIESIDDKINSKDNQCEI